MSNSPLIQLEGASGAVAQALGSAKQPRDQIVHWLKKVKTAEVQAVLAVKALPSPPLLPPLLLLPLPPLILPFLSTREGRMATGWPMNSVSLKLVLW